MYVTTFYSFKGGVGRTFALVNVGVELARTGRKVLLVDFDLEAPGIHTFDTLGSKEPHPGVVECVTDYMATQSAPDVRQYVYEKTDVAEESGRMWIMPAGRGDREYRGRLASINWQSLYRDLDGYLFFEDLKAQWKEAFDPDYVLIDSRTGHTDIEGICTRQLPDAAVILFFPNQQNLCGLREVVHDIKAESDRARKNRAPVKLHFVMSNVPDLDDEDGILRNRMREFGRALEYQSLCRIHNYPSLALLNQTIFTQERRKSRLSKEYRRLKDQIVDQNDEDPEGVVRFLKGLITPRFPGPRVKMADAEKRLQSIQEKHADIGEVMFLLGLVRRNLADLVEAAACFDRAMELGFQESAVLLERATCRTMTGDHSRAADDLQLLLQQPNLGDYEFHRAIQLLSRSDKRLLHLVPRSTAFQTLEADEKWSIAKSLSEEGALEASAAVFRTLTEDADTPEGLRETSRLDQILALMGLSRSGDAMQVLSSTRPSIDELAIQDVFNYAMAEWAQSGEILKEFFARVIELEDSVHIKRRQPANYEQCLAVAFWAIGDPQGAQERIERSMELAQNIRKAELSCWRYREVSRDEFLEDCKAIRELIRTGEGRPLFFPTE